MTESLLQPSPSLLPTSTTIIHTHLEVEPQGILIGNAFLRQELNWNIKLSKNINWNSYVWYVKNICSFDAMLKLGLDVSLIPAISNLVASLGSIGD